MSLVFWQLGTEEDGKWMLPTVETQHFPESPLAFSREMLRVQTGWNDLALE